VVLILELSLSYGFKPGLFVAHCGSGSLTPLLPLLLTHQARSCQFFSDLQHQRDLFR